MQEVGEKDWKETKKMKNLNSDTSHEEVLKSPEDSQKGSIKLFRSFKKPNRSQTSLTES